MPETANNQKKGSAVGFYIKCKYGAPPVEREPGDKPGEVRYVLATGERIVLNMGVVSKSREFKALLAGLQGDYDFRRRVADENSALYETGISAYEEREASARVPLVSKDNWPTFRKVKGLIEQARAEALDRRRTSPVRRAEIEEYDKGLAGVLVAQEAAKDPDMGQITFLAIYRVDGTCYFAAAKSEAEILKLVDRRNMRTTNTPTFYRIFCNPQDLYLNVKGIGEITPGMKKEIPTSRMMDLTREIKVAKSVHGGVQGRSNGGRIREDEEVSPTVN